MRNKRVFQNISLFQILKQINISYYTCYYFPSIWLLLSIIRIIIFIWLLYFMLRILNRGRATLVNPPFLPPHKQSFWNSRITWDRRYKKMWYECKWDISPSKSQFIKVNHYRSKYGLQHGALAHTKQQAIKDPKTLLV